MMLRLFHRPDSAEGGGVFTVHGQKAVDWVAAEIFGTDVEALKKRSARGPYLVLNRSICQSLVGNLLRGSALKQSPWSGIQVWQPRGKSAVDDDEVEGDVGEDAQEVDQDEQRLKMNWKCVCRATPGHVPTWMEDWLSTGGNESLISAPVSMAIQFQSTQSSCFSSSMETDSAVHWGLVLVNAARRHCCLLDGEDTELLSTLESIVVQWGVRECILSKETIMAEEGNETTSTAWLYRKLKTVLDRCQVAVTECPAAAAGDDGSSLFAKQLQRVLLKDSFADFQQRKYSDMTMSAGAILFNYLELAADSPHQYQLIEQDLNQFMKLDGSAVQALSLFPQASDGANKNASIYGLLNHCETPQGSRLLMEWLKQPLLDITEIQRRQDFIQVFMEEAEVRVQLQQEHLKRVPDLTRLAKRFQRGQGGLQEVVRVYQVVVRLPAIVALLEELETGLGESPFVSILHTTFTQEFQRFSKELAKFRDMVETTVDLQAAEEHEYIIKPDFDQDLLRLRQRMDELHAEVGPEQVRVSRDLHMELDKKLKLDRNGQHGYFFRVSRADAGALSGRREYTELGTQKAGVLFTTKTLKRISEEFMEASADYDSTQAKLVKEVVAIVNTYCPLFEQLNDVYGHLDVFISLSDVAANAPLPYTRPTIHPMGQGNLILTAARHPCLEVQPTVDFIPNDVQFVRDNSEFIIITGPNMGGKSTYIRQVGCIVLMAQIGSFVPCEQAELPIFDSILARVGAGDCQQEGVSTFMAEMLETAAILRSASKNSLIIIDELGRGTSTYDGFGLAWAISEYIATKIHAFCMFATHFHELTTLSDCVSTVKNLHVTSLASKDGIALLYKVDQGISEQSFGIHVARVAQFPDTVVQMAKRKADELECSNANYSDFAKKQGYDEGDIQNGLKTMNEFMSALSDGQDVKELYEKMRANIEGNRWLQEQVIQGL